MRLIDADWSLEIVRDQGRAHPNAYHLTNYASLILMEAPTIDPVHAAGGCYCRECEYWQDNDVGYPHIECGWMNEATSDPDGFCSYGRRGRKNSGMD